MSTQEKDPAMAAAMDICRLIVPEFANVDGWNELTDGEKKECAATIRSHFITQDYYASIRASRTVQDEFDRLEQASAALRAELGSLAAKVAELESDLAAALADTARLDWLDGIREPRTQWSGDPNDEPELVGYTWGIEAQAMDIRTAIDAAMGSRGEGKR